MTNEFRTEHLDVDENLVHQFELVCGKCSPLPELDSCGVFKRFPARNETCSPLCAKTIVVWYDENFR